MRYAYKFMIINLIKVSDLDGQNTKIRAWSIMFKKLRDMIKERPESGVTIFSPLEGEAIPISEVNDPAFSEEIVGRGAAIRPSRGRVVAPADGEVSMMFKTGHAVALTLPEGMEVLIHVGLDTVNLNGSFYTTHVHNGDKVKKGDLLIEFDMEAIANEGYDLVTPVVVTNHEDFKSVSAIDGQRVAEGDALIDVNV